MVFLVPWWIPIGLVAALVLLMLAACVVEARMVRREPIANIRSWLAWFLRG